MCFSNYLYIYILVSIYIQVCIYVFLKKISDVWCDFMWKYQWNIYIFEEISATASLKKLKGQVCRSRVGYRDRPGRLKPTFDLLGGIPFFSSVAAVHGGAARLLNDHTIK